MPCQEHLVNQPYIIVVDDDEFVRRSIVKRLVRMNCTVKDFESGEALLKSLEDPHEIPDAILLDYKMHGMNGIETLRALRGKNSSIPAFIFTAYVGEKELRLAEQLGNCEVVQKTVDLHSLTQIVDLATALKNLRTTECSNCQDDGILNQDG
jgi:CheY-like chemotaxis protein